MISFIHAFDFFSLLSIKDKSDKTTSRQDLSPLYGKDISDVHHPPGFNVGYLVSPYYANGAAASMVSLIRPV